MFNEGVVVVRYIFFFMKDEWTKNKNIVLTKSDAS